MCGDGLRIFSVIYYPMGVVRDPWGLRPKTETEGAN